MAAKLGSISANSYHFFCKAPFISWTCIGILPLAAVLAWGNVGTDKIPALIVAMSLFSTAAWTYWHLLIPVVRDNKEIFGENNPIFVWFITFSVVLFIFSAYLILLYGWHVFLRDDFQPSDIYHFGDGGLGSRLFSDLVLHHHGFVFILLYTIVDIFVWWGAAKSHDGWRRRFANIVVFVDAPILFGIAAISFFIRPLMEAPNTHSYYFFESGAIAFQLLVGTLLVIALNLVAEDQA